MEKNPENKANRKPPKTNQKATKKCGKRNCNSITEKGQITHTLSTQMHTNTHTQKHTYIKRAPKTIIRQKSNRKMYK